MAHDQSKTVILGLYRAYFLAFLLIISTLVLTYAATLRSVSATDGHAAIINESGRQRMLSQRLLYFATAYSETGASDLKAELESTASRFDRNHDLLRELAAGDPSMSPLYFEGSPSLDSLAEGFIEDARRVAADDGDASQALERMQAVGPDLLLNGLDQAVSGWQAQSDWIAAKILDRVRLGLIGTILILFVVALAILWPSVRFVRKVLGEVSTARTGMMESIQRLERFASVGSDLLWQTDLKGRIAFLEGGFVDRGIVDKAGVMDADHTDIIQLNRTERERMWDAIKAGEPYRGIRGRYRSANGKTYMLELSGAPNINEDGKVTGYYGAAKDISKQVDRDAKYRVLAEHATDVILTFGEDRVIKYVSPSVTQFGRKPADLIGKRTVDFIHPDDLPVLAEMNRNLFSDEDPDPTQDREFRAFKADGEIVWLEGRPSIVRDDKGKAVLAISSYRDITLRKQREAELEEARAMSEAAVKAKADFLSNMSHEIRTPLNGVLGFTQILRGMKLDSDQADCVDRIERAGKTLLEIVNDILDFSKIEAGKMTLDLGVVDLNAITSETFELIKAARPNKFVSYELDLPEDGPVVMEGDDVRLRQIITNLLANAAKFTETGTVRLSVTQAGDRVEIDVEDTGVGIPMDKLEKIFESFSQSDGSITRRFGGTGLGLSITKSLVHMMQGEIRIESAEGFGTRVSVELPFVAAELPEATDADGGMAERQSDLGIIVIDDVEMNRELIRVHLSRLGYEVACYATAQEAIDWLEAGVDFDLILMDVQMPEIDGLTATRMIRALPGDVRDIPIVALTANALSDEIEACFDAGMDGYLAKPVDLDELVRTIEQLAGGRRTHAGGAPSPASLPIDSQPETPVDPEGDVGNDPEYEAILQDCIAFISEAQRSVRQILAGTSDTDQLEALLATAHRVAGTVGFFGFDTLSDAAFRLEAAAKALLAGKGETADLKTAAEAFDEAADEIAA